MRSPSSSLSINTSSNGSLYVESSFYGKHLSMSSTYFGLLAEFGEPNIPLARVAPKYFGLSVDEAKRRAPGKTLPCRVFRLGGQKAPWLVSAADLAELIDRARERAAIERAGRA
jgi:hypothetical protein